MRKPCQNRYESPAKKAIRKPCWKKLTGLSGYESPGNSSLQVDISPFLRRHRLLNLLYVLSEHFIPIQVLKLRFIEAHLYLSNHLYRSLTSYIFLSSQYLSLIRFSSCVSLISVSILRYPFVYFCVSCDCLS